MFKSYLKIAYRNLRKNKTSSFINISGLAIGMAVAILIGLWIWDEISYNKSFENYDRIGLMMQNQESNGKIHTFNAMPEPLAPELRNRYGNNFKYVISSSWTGDHIISSGQKNLSKRGIYMQAEAPHMLTLKMLAGTRDGLKDPHTV